MSILRVFSLFSLLVLSHAAFHRSTLDVAIEAAAKAGKVTAADVMMLAKEKAGLERSLDGSGPRRKDFVSTELGEE